MCLFTRYTVEKADALYAESAANSTVIVDNADGNAPRRFSAAYFFSTYNYRVIAGTAVSTYGSVLTAIRGQQP
jgi:hypothetical protein